jgi:hypothetical protein
VSRISEIEQRLSKRTQGEWKYDGVTYIFCGSHMVAEMRGYGADLDEDANAEFIAHAPSDLAYLLEQVKWIPVEERLPEPGVSVLCYAPNYGEIAVSRRPATATSNEWDDMFELQEDCGADGLVTHWKPLGESPAEVAK